MDVDSSPAPVLAGRYRLDNLIARGGMGVVWRGLDLELGRAVAVKVVRDELAHDPVVVERFRREARAAAALTHPNVAAVYDLVDDETHLAIVMELVKGETLGARLRADGRLAVAAALHVADGVLAALDEAHAAGIVHRDVTPGNVMLANDPAGETVKVTDFGVAVLASEAATRLTATGTVLGTAPYLAPEQLEGRRPTPATDQYSAAVVVYEALTGRRPFEGEHPAALALARMTTDPQPLRDHRPEVAPAIEQAVLRAMSRAPEDRFASAGDFRRALAGTFGDGAVAVTEPHTTTHPLVVTPDPGSPTSERRSRGPFARRRLAFALISIATAVLAALVAARAAQSPDSATAVVPNLVGMALPEAEATALRAGLRVSARDVASPEAAGIVVAQDHPEGAELDDGAVVGLDVSVGEPPPSEVPPDDPPPAEGGDTDEGKGEKDDDEDDDDKGGKGKGRGKNDD